MRGAAIAGLSLLVASAAGADPITLAVALRKEIREGPFASLPGAGIWTAKWIGRFGAGRAAPPSLGLREDALPGPPSETLLVAEGTTSLPDGAILSGSLYYGQIREECLLRQERAEVSGGRFGFSAASFSGPLFPGTYRLETVFQPYDQGEEVLSKFDPRRLRPAVARAEFVEGTDADRAGAERRLRDRLRAGFERLVAAFEDLRRRFAARAGSRRAGGWEEEAGAWAQSVLPFLESESTPEESTIHRSLGVPREALVELASGLLALAGFYGQALAAPPEASADVLTRVRMIEGRVTDRLRLFSGVIGLAETWRTEAESRLEGIAADRKTLAGLAEGRAPAGSAGEAWRRECAERTVAAVLGLAGKCPPRLVEPLQRLAAAWPDLLDAAAGASAPDGPAAADAREAWRRKDAEVGRLLGLIRDGLH